MTSGYGSGSFGGGALVEGRWWSAGMTINVMSH
jgi:hypothetical protein